MTDLEPRTEAAPRWHHSPDAPPEHFCADCDAARAAVGESGRLREALAEALTWGGHDSNCPVRYAQQELDWCQCAWPQVSARLAALLATPPAPSDHGALDVERLAAAMEVISFHMMPRHPGAEFAQAIAAEYARLAAPSVPPEPASPEAT